MQFTVIGKCGFLQSLPNMIAAHLNADSWLFLILPPQKTIQVHCRVVLQRKEIVARSTYSRLKAEKAAFNVVAKRLQGQGEI